MSKFNVKTPKGSKEIEIINQGIFNNDWKVYEIGIFSKTFIGQIENDSINTILEFLKKYYGGNCSISGRRGFIPRLFHFYKFQFEKD